MLRGGFVADQEYRFSGPREAQLFASQPLDRARVGAQRLDLGREPEVLRAQVVELLGEPRRVLLLVDELEDAAVAEERPDRQRQRRGSRRRGSPPSGEAWIPDAYRPGWP